MEASRIPRLLVPPTMLPADRNVPESVDNPHEAHYLSVRLHAFLHICYRNPATCWHAGDLCCGLRLELPKGRRFAQQMPVERSWLILREIPCPTNWLLHPWPAYTRGQVEILLLAT